MITHINAENRSKYQYLFDTAKTKLIELKENGHITNAFIDSNIVITNLNDYFSYLNDLLTGIAKDEDSRGILTNDRFYFSRLPLDEDLFEIDANSRIIKVPAVFNKNGVSVQSDEISEILYFSINRYYEAMDLGSNDVHIVIQWETKDAEGNTIQGISSNYGKDVEHEYNKIIFGWPISHELTAAAGTIKFAVRFYQLQDDNLKYSFSTLPAEVSIKASLAYDVTDEEKTLPDYSNLIIGRISSNGIYDVAGPVPVIPDITTDLFYLNENNEIITIDPEEEYDLNTQGRLTIGIELAKKDTSTAEVEWLKYPALLNDPTAYGDNASTSVGEIYYQLVNTFDENHIYYKVITKDENTGLISRVQEIALNDIDPESEDEYCRLYHIYTIEGIGKYAPKLIARDHQNSIASTPTNQYIKVPGPATPEITIANMDRKVITNGHMAILKANATQGESSSVTSVNLDYKWYNPSSELLENLQACKINVLPLAVNENTSSDDEELRHNQETSVITQNGNNIVIYAPEALQSYARAEGGLEKPWVGIDIDTHVSLNNASYGDVTYNETETQTWLGEGKDSHIIHWIDTSITETLSIDVTIDEVTTTLNISVVSGSNPANPVYTLSENHNELYIYGLMNQTLDVNYKVAAEVTRNGNTRTDEDEDGYRITNYPKAPTLFYRTLVGSRFENKEASEWPSTGYDLRGSRNLRVLVGTNLQSDKLKYAWLRMREGFIEQNGQQVINPNVQQIVLDLPDQLEEFFNLLNFNSSNDTTALDDELLTEQLIERQIDQLTPIEDVNDARIIEFNITGTNEEAKGYYYGIVINELNGKYAVSLTPLFYVS